MSTTFSSCSVSETQFRSLLKSTMFTTLNKSYSLKNKANLAVFFRTRTCSSTPIKSLKSNNLFSRISPLRHHSHVIPVIEQWVEEGRRVQKIELQRIIRDLRSRKRYSQALQVSEWMSCGGLCTFSPGDRAVHLDLIGVVRGWNAAESYFHSLKDQEKNDKTYGALLNCYVREGLLDKSLRHVEKMKEMGCASNTLVYNNLMCLYKSAGQPDKVTEVLVEMKENGVIPNNFSYRICINCYGEKSDLTNLGKLLEEMENQPHICMDWTTYSVVSNHYIRANLKEKAIICLKKLEDTLHRDAVGYNHLISLYSQLGNADEVMRLWGVQEVVCKKHINRDYIAMLGALVKLGELGKAEIVLEEWESSCHTYDFRVPNILLIGYCQRDLIEKAEAMLRSIVKKGKVPTPNSWGIVSAGYMNRDNMEKAYECMKEALVVREQNQKWAPKPGLVTNVLNWLGDNGEIEEVEAFVSSLRTVTQVNKYMDHALIKANIRGRKDSDWILESMKADGIQKDEEIEKIQFEVNTKMPREREPLILVAEDYNKQSLPDLIQELNKF